MKAPLLAALLFAVLVAACGGGDEIKVQKASSPDELGVLIGGTYVAMSNEAAALLQPRPSPNQVKPHIDSLKERYARAFVEYGRQREAMSKDDKDRVVVVSRAYVEQKPPNNPTWWVDAVNHYSAMDDPSVWRAVFSLRDLTQYAFWELLKKQEPEEAKRLGVK